MKTTLKIAMIVAMFATASVSMASNPKCNHRVASSGNDLFKDTNPDIKVAKKETRETDRRGKR